MPISCAELIRFDRKAERRRRSLEFDRIPAGGTLQVELALNTEKNTPAAEQKIYSEILKGLKGGQITLIDIGGKSIEKAIAD